MYNLNCRFYNAESTMQIHLIPLLLPKLPSICLIKGGQGLSRQTLNSLNTILTSNFWIFLFASFSRHQSEQFGILDAEFRSKMKQEQTKLNKHRVVNFFLGHNKKKFLVENHFLQENFNRYTFHNVTKCYLDPGRVEQTKKSGLN